MPSSYSFVISDSKSNFISVQPGPVGYITRLQWEQHLQPWHSRCVFRPAKERNLWRYFLVQFRIIVTYQLGWLRGWVSKCDKWCKYKLARPFVWVSVCGSMARQPPLCAIFLSEFSVHSTHKMEIYADRLDPLHTYPFVCSFEDHQRVNFPFPFKNKNAR